MSLGECLKSMRESYFCRFGVEFTRSDRFDNLRSDAFFTSIAVGIRYRSSIGLHGGLVGLLNFESGSPTKLTKRQLRESSAPSMILRARLRYILRYSGKAPHERDGDRE